MIAAVAQPKQQAIRSTDRERQSAIRTPDDAKAGPASRAEQSRLQAVHAGKHGVILKGLRHETFWEW